jgi:RNA polymerase primary sigma factor
LCHRKNQTQKNNGRDFSPADLKEHEAFVLKAAKKYKSLFPSLDIEDLIEEGRSGLLEASLKYKSGGNASFSTYAWYWIIKRIQKYVSNNSGILRIPEKERQVFSAVKSFIREQTKKGLRTDIEQIAAALNIDSSKVSDVVVAGDNALNAFSLDKEIESESDSGSFSQIIGDKSGEDGLSRAVSSRKSELFEAAFSKLSEDEKNVVSLRYCLDGGEEKRVSYKEIASRMKIPLSKAKKLESDALLKLKALAKEIDE